MVIVVLVMMMVMGHIPLLKVSSTHKMAHFEFLQYFG